MKKIAVLIIALAASLLDASAQVHKTVQKYDAPTHPNIADINAPGSLPKALFTLAVSNAWLNNKGGVVDYDVTSTAPWNVSGIPSWTAYHGIAGINTIQINYGPPVVVGPIMFGGQWMPISGSPNQPGACRTVNAGPLIFKINTGTPLGVRAAGLTVLQRKGFPQFVKVTFLLGSGGSLVYSFTMPAWSGVGLPPADTFVGRNVPAVTGGIVAVIVDSYISGSLVPLHVAIDDFAYVTF